MSELSSDRLQESPSFTYCNFHLFDTFTIKNYRRELKRLGVIFVCFYSRAIHTEIAHSSKTDSFTFLLRKFTGRLSNIHLMKSDNGNNFVGAISELWKAFQELDHNQISQNLQTHRGNWIIWDQKPNHSKSHGWGFGMIDSNSKNHPERSFQKKQKKFEQWSTTHVADRCHSNC